MLAFFKIRSIQTKMVFWTVLCLVVTMAAIISISTYSMYQMARESSENAAIEKARTFGSRVKSELEAPLNMAHALANALSTSPDNLSEPLDRESVSSIIRQTVMRNPAFLGISTLWEPNAFDGKDSAFIYSPGHDATGRFMVYWARKENGTVAREALIDYENAEWYLCPQRTGRECLVGPYEYTLFGKKTLMISLVAPIEKNGRFAGIVGIDLTTEVFQEWAEQESDFQLALISNDGKLVAATHQPDLIGQPAQTIHADFESELPRVRNGEFVHEYRMDTHNLEIFLPVEVGRTTAPWSVSITAPEAEIARPAEALLWRQIIIGSLLAGLGLLLVWFLARQIALPVQRLTQTAERITAGELDLTARGNANDETGVLANAFNQMVAQLKTMLAAEHEQRAALESTVRRYVEFMDELSRGNLAARVTVSPNGHGDDPLILLGNNLNTLASSLQNMIRQISEAVTSLSTASAEILAATTQQASGASEQSAAIAQTTTTVDEVKAIGEQAVLRAQEVVVSANRTVEVSQTGQQSVRDTIESMAQIKARVEGIAENILALSEQTQQIGEIIATVSDIASQSNMLALNASVEAARAGEHGKGFAVVAAEVRSLAEQSRQATVQIKAILQDIQKATNTTVMATEEGAKVVEQGVRLADRSRAAIEQLSSAIEEAAQRATQVVVGGRQQTSGVDQIAVAMQNINQAMVQSLASTRQAEKAAQDLNQLAHNLAEMVKRYTL